MLYIENLQNKKIPPVPSQRLAPEHWSEMWHFAMSFDRFQRILLEHGTFFQKTIVFEELGEKKNCFCNAAAIALSENSNLFYCEGIATMRELPDLPIKHAWLADESGTAIEVTWPEPAGFYLGVVFQQKALEKLIDKNKTCSFFFDDDLPNYFKKDPNLWKSPKFPGQAWWSSSESA